MFSCSLWVVDVVVFLLLFFQLVARVNGYQKYHHIGGGGGEAPTEKLKGLNFDRAGFQAR